MSNIINPASVLLALTLLLIGLDPLLGNALRLDEKTLAAAEKEYGAGARRRLESWQELVANDKSGSDMDKLTKVNRFFNRVQFVDDIKLWKTKDYWATPIEFLSRNAGDCEDFSIAKYFTLKAMGVDEEKLLMTYVKAIKLNQAHMVLAYYEKPAAEPLILDNIDPTIKKGSQRTDLAPVYTFNASGLWLAQQRGKGKKAGSASKLSRWTDLLKRMGQG